MKSQPKYRKLALFIDGQFLERQRRDTRQVFNPATGEELAELPLSRPADLEDALAVAQAAFETWRHSSPLTRSEVLHKAAELLRLRVEAIAVDMTRDQGKPLAEARAEVLGSADHAQWHAEECRRIYGRVIPARHRDVRQMVLREPVGVCAAFTPWNFPCSQAIRKICAAIGAGCTIILKGPEESPSAIVAIAEIFRDAGLPNGVLNIVWGVPSEVSDALLRSPVVRHLSFTGSVFVGKRLAALAAAGMKRMVLELGGHAPVIVCDDVDVSKVAHELARFKVRNAGQVCIAPTRFYVHEAVYDSFVQKFSSEMRAIRVGSGLDAETEMGPLAHERRIVAMEEFVGDAVSRGANVLVGGERLDRRGLFFAPTVVVDAPDDAMLMRDEPFGPIAPIARFSEDEEALLRANSVSYGLASYVFTQNLRRAHLFSRDLQAGMVNINHFGSGLPETPVGGVKDSGVGSEGGSETFDSYLVTKFVSQM